MQNLKCTNRQILASYERFTVLLGISSLIEIKIHPFIHRADSAENGVAFFAVRPFGEEPRARSRLVLSAGTCAFLRRLVVPGTKSCPISNCSFSRLCRRRFRRRENAFLTPIGTRVFLCFSEKRHPELNGHLTLQLFALLDDALVPGAHNRKNRRISQDE